MSPIPPTFIDFFAGSGLVSEGVSRTCKVVWANDICPKKTAIYTANHDKEHFHLKPIQEVSGSSIPEADIAWGSFPCQDLSLAGKMIGLEGNRSGLFWEWLRVIGEMKTPPNVLVLENVVGLLTSNGGEDFRTLIAALEERSYRVGSAVMDALEWLPQSRPRVFIVAVKCSLDTSVLEDHEPNWLQPQSIQKATKGIRNHVNWWMPVPPKRESFLSDIVEWNAPTFEPERFDKLFSLVPKNHLERLLSIPPNKKVVLPGYRRTRKGKQVLELRFDNISGCLRTAEGGSSCQFLLLHQGGDWQGRKLTVREAARLMGAPETYQLSESYNESYSAMGDAVAAPVVDYLAENLLVPLSKAPIRTSATAFSGGLL